MTDTFTPEKRSQIMSQVKGRNTKPEIIVRKILHRLGYRFRLHQKDLPGKPDIVLPKYRKIIFVHGCFWHGHNGCKRASRPTENTDFWNAKLDSNIKRDTENIEKLKLAGWSVLAVWQCETKNETELADILVRFLNGTPSAEAEYNND